MESLSLCPLPFSFFVWTTMGKVTLQANNPSWISNAVADQTNATTECLFSYSFLSDSAYFQFLCMVLVDFVSEPEASFLKAEGLFTSS